MTVVESVLEMLRARFPGFDVELGPRFRTARSRAARAEPKVEEEPLRRARSRARRRPSSGSQARLPDPRPDPVLAASYAELGVPYGADLREVRRAWKRLVRENHPDFHGDDPERQRRSTERMKRLNQACEEIKRRLEALAPEVRR